MKLSIQKTNASGLIALRQTEEERVEAVKDFLFGGPRITAEGVSSHGIKRHLLLGRKAMTKLDSVLESRHHFADNDCIVQAMVFPVIMHGCENWNIKKAEC